MEGMSSQISHDERPGLTTFGVSRKRKDRDGPDTLGVHMTTKAAPAAPAHLLAPPQQPDGAGGNGLLAGYLAHEFLTRGTLFGERWEPAPASKPPPSQGKEPTVPGRKQKQPAEAEQGKPPRAYAEVTHLLKTDGAHVPGVVNPTQLAQWLQM